MITECMVSIIIPIFNKEEYISACLDSVIKQTHRRLEIICIDDGSNDSSAEVVKEYCKTDNRIIQILKKNTGVGDCRNIGIKKSTGKYICFIDPDDYYPNRNVIKNLVECAENNDMLIAGGSFSSIKNGIIVTKYEGLNQKYTFNEEGVINYTDYQFEYGFQRFIFNRDLIIKNNIFFPNYIRFQDPYFLVCALSRAKKFYALREPTYCYREAYKEIKWDLSKKIDNLNGMHDCIKLAKDENYLELATRIRDRISSAYYKNILCRVNNRYEIQATLDKLYEISQTLTDMGIDTESFNGIHDTLNAYLKKPLHLPKISVIIPIYNVEEYIGDCINSVLNQTLSDFEIICVNDGTKDNSAKICEDYATRDSRIKIIHKFNGGLSNARNTGADFSNGEYLYFLDSDDMIPQTALEQMYTNLKNNDLDILFFDADTMFDSNNMEKTHNQFLNMYSNRMPTTGVMTGNELLTEFIKKDAYRSPVQLSAIKKEFYVKHSIHCYPGILHEDNLYTTESTLFAKRTMYLAKKLYIRRIREESIMTSTKTINNFKGYVKCYSELIKTYVNTDEDHIKNILEHFIWKNIRSSIVVFNELNYVEQKKVFELSNEDLIFLCTNPIIDEHSFLKKIVDIHITIQDGPENIQTYIPKTILEKKQINRTCPQFKEIKCNNIPSIEKWFSLIVMLNENKKLEEIESQLDVKIVIKDSKIQSKYKSPTCRSLFKKISDAIKNIPKP